MGFQASGFRCERVPGVGWVAVRVIGPGRPGPYEVDYIRGPLTP